MRRMMALANLLFGFFNTHAGIDEGAADLRMLPALESSCARVNTSARRGIAQRPHLQYSVLNIFSDGCGEIFVSWHRLCCL